MIIAISGKAGSGKDTVAKIIQWLILENNQENPIPFDIDRDYSIYPRNQWMIKKFAGKLKSSIEHKFPNHFNAEKWEKGGDEYRNEYIDFLQMTRREWLIKEAMLMRDEIHPDYWVNSLIQDYVKYTASWDDKGNSTLDVFPDWLITDMRFENELEAVDDRDGVTIRVERPGIPVIDSISEISLDQAVIEGRFNLIIYNDADISRLISKTKDALVAIGILDE